MVEEINLAKVLNHIRGLQPPPSSPVRLASIAVFSYGGEECTGLSFDTSVRQTHNVPVGCFGEISKFFANQQILTRDSRDTNPRNGNGMGDMGLDLSFRSG
jgi:hypothetical protein